MIIVIGVRRFVEGVDGESVLDFQGASFTVRMP